MAYLVVFRIFESERGPQAGESLNMGLICNVVLRQAHTPGQTQRAPERLHMALLCNDKATPHAQAGPENPQRGDTSLQQTHNWTMLRSPFVVLGRDCLGGPAAPCITISLHTLHTWTTLGPPVWSLAATRIPKVIGKKCARGPWRPKSIPMVIRKM